LNFFLTLINLILQVEDLEIVRALDHLHNDFLVLKLNPPLQALSNLSLQYFMK